MMDFVFSSDSLHRCGASGVVHLRFQLTLSSISMMRIGHLLLPSLVEHVMVKTQTPFY